MKVYIGADHAGFKLKEKLKLFLNKNNYSIFDLGASQLIKDDDYPKYASAVGKLVAKNKDSFGILICGSGHGVCIAANKVKGIRAVLCEHIKDTFYSRRDDDANVLCLQGRYTNFFRAKKLVKKFLETKFADEYRYKRRINQIKRLER